MRRRMLLLLLGIVACCQSTDPGDVPAGLVFLSLSTEPNAVMDALFNGRVVTDAAGCLRLQSSEAATVVWPKGFSLGNSVEGVIVRNAAGVEIGRLQDTFKFGGGYVGTLDAIPIISDATRKTAYQKCPGTYWIVGQTDF